MSKEKILLCTILALKLVLQLCIVNSAYDLQRDEYLHLDQGHHLAWGYLSVPPVSSWVSFIIHALGGQAFWVRFFPALAGILTIYIVMRATKVLGGGLFAQALVGMGLLFSTMLRLNMLFQPNAIDVLMWAMIYYFLIEYFKSEHQKWLYYLALAFAFGFLNKYNIVFAFLGLLPAIVITKQRKVFNNKHLYFSAILALAIMFPNLWWQYKEGFPVIHHMADLSKTQLVNNDLFSFLKSQPLFFLGSIPVILAAIYSLAFYRNFFHYRFMFWSMVFTLGLFIWFRAKDYYAFGIYPMYLAFGSVYLERIIKQKHWGIKTALLALPFVSLLPIMNILFPVRSPEYVVANAAKFSALGMLRWEDGKDHDLPQDYADMLGWEELAVTVDSVYGSMDAPGNTIVLADNYGQAGAINYYSRRTDYTANSFNADYVNWIDTSIVYKNVILIKEPWDEDPERNNEKSLFDTIYLAATRVNNLAREDKINIYVLKGAKGDINRRIMDEIMEEKNAFKR